MERSLRERIKCRLNGHGEIAEYSIEDALKKLDKLIWKTANNFHMKVPHLDIDDLYQQGRCGVLAAWQKFDSEKNIAFITYANWWILKYVQTFCSANEYPVSLNSQNQKIYKEMCMQQGTTQSGAVAEQNKALASLVKANTGLTKKLDKDEFSEEDKRIQQVEETQHSSPILASILCALRQKLSPQEFYIVVGSSGILHANPLSVQEISAKLDISREKVRHIKNKHARLLLEVARPVESRWCGDGSSEMAISRHS